MLMWGTNGRLRSRGPPALALNPKIRFVISMLGASRLWRHRDEASIACTRQCAPARTAIRSHGYGPYGRVHSIERAKDSMQRLRPCISLFGASGLAPAMIMMAACLAYRGVWTRRALYWNASPRKFF